MNARPSAADTAFAEGVKAFQTSRPTDAEAAFRRALGAEPRHWRARYLLGIALHQQGRNGQAAEAIKTALELEPRNAEVAANLGVVLRAAGRPADAAVAFRLALDIDASLVTVMRQLAAVLYETGEIAQAEPLAREAASREPGNAEGLTTLATILEAKRGFAEAETLFRAAILHAPGLPEAHNGLGAALRGQGRDDQAIECFARAVALRPGFAQALTNLSAALADEGRLEEAARAARGAVGAAPDLAEAHGNLGNALKDLGLIGEAIVTYRRALALKPDLAAAHSNLIFALDYDPATTWPDALAERRRWNERFAADLTKAAPPHDNDPDPDRRIRVGYVSADFRRHSAALVIAPPILAHDREAVDVVCYASVRRADDMTAMFRERATLWRDVAGLSDEELARLIRSDRIDILVDLSGHSGGNRLLAFARRPAPIQITAWGYASGVGVDAIDWIVTDDVVAPPDEKTFLERPLRLPAYLCFRPPDDAPAVPPAPAARNGFMTFGGFNRIVKLGEADFDAGARILAALPTARLLFKDRAFDATEPRERFAQAFGARGVDPARLDFVGATDHKDHLRAYGRVDLALDPLGYGGGVSAMEAMWMGVPVLTLRGDRPSLRGAASMLLAMGLDEFVATSADDYVARAIDLAGRPARLANLRKKLRGILAACPHMRAEDYARSVEAAFRRLWRDWCAGRNASMLRRS